MAGLNFFFLALFEAEAKLGFLDPPPRPEPSFAFGINVIFACACQIVKPQFVVDFNDHVIFIL
jgi:hypothetical protein